MQLMSVFGVFFAVLVGYFVYLGLWVGCFLLLPANPFANPFANAIKISGYFLGFWAGFPVCGFGVILVFVGCLVFRYKKAPKRLF